MKFDEPSPKDIHFLLLVVAGTWGTSSAHGHTQSYPPSTASSCHGRDKAYQTQSHFHAPPRCADGRFLPLGTSSLVARIFFLSWQLIRLVADFKPGVFLVFFPQWLQVRFRSNGLSFLLSEIFCWQRKSIPLTFKMPHWQDLHGQAGLSKLV